MILLLTPPLYRQQVVSLSQSYYVILNTIIWKQILRKNPFYALTEMNSLQNMFHTTTLINFISLIFSFPIK